MRLPVRSSYLLRFQRALASPLQRKVKQKISTLSQLINNRSDALEKMVGDNALKIEGLKKTVDFVCAELNDIKGKVGHVETRLNTEEKKMELCEKKNCRFGKILSLLEPTFAWST